MAETYDSKVAAGTEVESIATELSTKMNIADRVTAAALNDLNARVEALESTGNNLGDVVADSLDAQVLKKGGVDVASAADITDAIQSLDVSSVGGTGKYIKAISQTDGKISATEVTLDSTPTSGHTDTTVTSAGIKTALDTKADDSAVVHLTGQETLTGEKQFKNGATFINSGNTGKMVRVLNSLAYGTKYSDWDPSLKDGQHFRKWCLAFPSSVTFKGKMRLSITSAYSNYNSYGLLSKTFSIAFNNTACYLNIGYYDDLGKNIETEFRISDFLFNATDNRWEIEILSIKPGSDNPVPVIVAEFWGYSSTDLNAARQFNAVSSSPTIVTDTTYTNAWRNKTFNWADNPVFQTPYGDKVLDDSMFDGTTTNKALTKKGTFETFPTSADVDSAIAGSVQKLADVSGMGDDDVHAYSGAAVSEAISNAISGSTGGYLGNKTVAEMNAYTTPKMGDNAIVTDTGTITVGNVSCAISSAPAEIRWTTSGSWVITSSNYVNKNDVATTGKLGLVKLNTSNGGVELNSDNQMVVHGWSTKADVSDLTALSNRVTTAENDIDSVENSIANLQTTVSGKVNQSDAVWTIDESDDAIIVNDNFMEWVFQV